MSGNPSSTIRIRKNVQTLGNPGDDLDWYGKAVAELQSRPVTDPTSWRYLAAVHGYLASEDPNPTNVPFPSTSDQNKFWNQCQHQSWYFEPWHRAYLICFEQIIAAAVVKVNGPAGWALPYWNYSDPANNNQARLLPAAFVPSTLSNNGPNPLFVAGRNSATANFNIPDQDVSLNCLNDTRFTGGSTGAHPGFGGPNTGFSHSGRINGGVEDVPHNQIHDDIGGLMGDPLTAALDPIFWLHHANIDRLWEIWRKTLGNSDLTDPAWLTGQSFQLHDTNGNVLTFTASQVLDTTTLLHGYRYDDISNPHAVVAQAGAAATMVASASPPPAPPPAAPAPATQPELVGASAPVTLSDAQITVPVPFRAQVAQNARTRIAASRHTRAFLNIENVTGRGRLPKYDVYIDVPPAGQDASNRSPLLAGSLSLFGVQAASDPSGPQGGSGITSVIEITHLVDQLRSQGRWDESRMHVTFMRRGHPAGAAPMQDLHIGRISVYYD
jgi:tyrosinase